MNPTALHAPVEWTPAKRATGPGTVWRGTGGLTAIVSRDEGTWHVSVSHPRRYPTWDEMTSARDRFTPDHVTMALIMPPRAQYVNLHETCLQMWQVEP